VSIGQNSRPIAIVDDDEPPQSSLRDLIESEGLSTLCFGSAEQFLDSDARHKAACLMADIRMPGIPGLELQSKLNAERCRTPLIFITAHGDAETRILAIRDVAVQFLTKLFDDAALLEIIHTVLLRSGNEGVKGGASEGTCS
jgi:FixJ family two-component response regulator